MPGYPLLLVSTISADGTAVFTGSACAAPIYTDRPVCANGVSASVYSVDIASGTLLATIAPIQGASYILSVTADVVFGGSVVAGVIFSPDGQDSLESVSTLGVTARGAVAWDVGVSGPAPAPQASFTFTLILTFTLALNKLFFPLQHG